MSALTFLDVAIGLLFVYLLLSLICSVINEWVSAIFRRRPRNLESGLRNLLDGDRPGGLRGLFRGIVEWFSAAGRLVLRRERPAESGPFAEVAAHPLVLSMRQGEKFPSYLPAGVFTLALLDVMVPAGADGPTTVAQLRKEVAGIDHHLARVLLPLIDAAGGDMKKVRDNIEAWYNEAMDRVTGVYKRWNMLILFAIGLTLAVALNADTFSICKALWVNPALRQAVADAATKYVKDHAPPAAAERPEAKAGPRPEAQPTPAPASGPTAGAADGKADEGVPPFPSYQIETLVTKVQALKLLPSWREEWDQYARSLGRPAAQLTPWECWTWRLSKGLGLLFTAAAVSLGAPFWFDLLNRFVNIRSAIRTSDDTDNPAARRKRPPPAGASGTGGAGLDAETGKRA